MLPKVSPNSSLKNGPTVPSGSVCRMSPTFLRTSYQRSGTSAETRSSRAIRITCDSPGREYERTNSYCPVAITAFSIRSVTWRETSSAVAPGHSVCTTIARKVKGGSSDCPSCPYDHAPTSASTTMAYSTRPRLRGDHARVGRQALAHGDALGAVGTQHHGHQRDRVRAGIHHPHRGAAAGSLLHGRERHAQPGVVAFAVRREVHAGSLAERDAGGVL